MARRSPSLAAAALVILNACQPMENLHPDVHGHRGSRGLMPENTIPAFLKAIDLGCDFLELDVVLSGDDEVIVSHEPWMSGRICVTPDEERITPDRERSINLHRMTVTEIQEYDCGGLAHPLFPDQKRVFAYKPTLRQVVETCDEHALLSGMVSPSYNVEIKSDPEWYGTYQPPPADYAQRVIREIDDLGIANRCIVQSFDPAILEAIHAERSDIPLAFLVENTDGLKKNLKRLTFKPHIYSPHYGLVDKKLLEALREEDIELVVWTVNEKKDIRRMLDLGVDGIISDYPDRVVMEMEGRE
ncbi:MAG: glycerophosphodiester phosphodiesterase [Flavobacteriales bacterium]|nr:glycerophosphodiester phosphodiesterase [Flavobacteriales bacterium]